MTNPSGYYTSIYSGEEIDDAIGKLAELGDIVAENIPISETDSTTIAEALEKRLTRYRMPFPGTLRPWTPTGTLPTAAKRRAILRPRLLLPI